MYLMIAALILLCAGVTSCELKRTNPLDPNNNPNITAPPRVTGLTASGSGAGVLTKSATLTWTRNIVNTNGYYIYMGLAYNSVYARIDTLQGNVSTGNTMSKIVFVPSAGYYYFKVSAYRNTDNNGAPLNDNLEGSLSEWAIAHVEN